MLEFEEHLSIQDPSVNFVARVGSGQALEARYVRRHDDYVACYISTQTACKMACRFCHLTATRQVNAANASVREIVEQAQAVLNWYHLQPGPRADVIHYNFMSRGEPLESDALKLPGQVVFHRLARLAANYDLLPRFLVSSILPKSSEYLSFPAAFRLIHPEIYYSLYSLNPEFRRRWLPNAMDPEAALHKLYEWQRFSKKIIRIHYALIDGENDRLEDIHAITGLIKKIGLRADFTLVRYNPFSERHGRESEHYTGYAELLKGLIPGTRVKVVDRVGFDVAASCGTFLQI